MPASCFLLACCLSCLLALAWVFQPFLVVNGAVCASMCSRGRCNVFFFLGLFRQLSFSTSVFFLFLFLFFFFVFILFFAFVLVFIFVFFVLGRHPFLLYLKTLPSSRPFSVFFSDVVGWAQLLADMVCSPNDDKADKQLKRDVMSVFDRRLDEREKRKKFIIEHNLTGLNEKPQKKKAASKKRPKVRGRR